MKITNLILILIIATLIILGYSCKEKDPQNNPPTNEQVLKAVQDYSIASKLFSDAFSESDKAAKNSDDQIDNHNQGQKEGYPIITITPFDAVTWPKNITVDYGNTNYLCQDGRYRRGKILIGTTGFYRQAGTVITVTFDNYYQNDHKVEGTQVITNNGRGEDGFLSYTVNINQGRITTPEDKVIIFNESTVRKWIEGEETLLQHCDDVYEIIGSQSGISSNQITYTLTVIEALNVQVCCRWIRGGILNLDIEGLPTISVNYGNNTCDATATVTINGTENPIIMQ
ncbi:MAG: hypothetical protein WHW07_12205 [Bacteroidales bacterium]|jgi:hypothetical protein